MGILYGSDSIFWLVQQNIYFSLTLQWFAVKCYLVTAADTRSKLGHRPPVHLYRSLADQLIGLPAGTYPAVCYEAVKTYPLIRMADFSFSGTLIPTISTPAAAMAAAVTGSGMVTGTGFYVATGLARPAAFPAFVRSLLHDPQKYKLFAWFGIL